MNETQAVLFDLDGTLLDTANDLGVALNHVLASKGLPAIEREKYRPIASDGALGLLTLGFGEKLSQFNYDELRQEFLSYYQDNIATYTHLYSGIEALLLSLNEKDIPWGIVTNKPEYLTLLLLPHFEIFNHCKVVVGGDTLPKRKPDPEPILYACEQMNINSKNCLYVGDALRDIEAGNSANNKTIIAQWGYILPEINIHEWLADEIAEKPLDILLMI